MWYIEGVVFEKKEHSGNKNGNEYMKYMIPISLCWKVYGSDINNIYQRYSELDVKIISRHIKIFSAENHEEPYECFKNDSLANK